MPPPLLLLQDISLTFGAMPLLSGAALAVGAGDSLWSKPPGRLIVSGSFLPAPASEG
jgi:hypothetical protein